MANWRSLHFLRQHWPWWIGFMLFVLLVLFLIEVRQHEGTRYYNIGEVIPFPANHVELDDAFKEARKNLDHFLHKMKNGDGKADNFAVLIEFIGKNKIGQHMIRSYPEYIWLSVDTTKIYQEHLYGRYQTDSYFSPIARKGLARKFNKSKILDWRYKVGRRYVGYYTLPIIIEALEEKKRSNQR